jgi:hypothetical protein
MDNFIRALGILIKVRDNLRDAFEEIRTAGPCPKGIQELNTDLGRAYSEMNDHIRLLLKLTAQQ